MKNLSLKPGFEFIFSLSIIAILGLPPLVFGQDHKDLQISINNGDTTINGKNIKDLSAKDREAALKDINNIAVINSDTKTNGDLRRVVIVKRRNKKGGKADDVVITQQGTGDQYTVMSDGDDATGGRVETRTFRFDNRKGHDSTVNFSFRMNKDPQIMLDDRPGRRDMRVNDFRTSGDGGPMMMGFNRKNTQNFNYTNTDNDGVSTRVSFHVSDHQATLDHMDGAPEKEQMDMLDLQDLTIVPEFAAGKVVLMFSLPSKAEAEVKFKDSKGDMMWSEKVLNGNFSKSFPLGLNGTYFLQVKQGGKVAVKKIEKE